MATGLQNVAVLLIVLAALAYVGRRGWARVRGLVGRGGADSSSCATGCGTCGTEQTQARPAAAKVLVQIGRPPTRHPPTR